MKTIEKASIDDMLFENREKNYGAYVNRKQAPKRMMISLMIVGSMVLTLMVGQAIARAIGPGELPDLPKKRELILILEDLPDLPEQEEEVKVETPPEIKPPEQAPMTEVVIPEPTPIDELDPDEIDNTIHDQDTIAKAIVLGTEDREGDPDAVIDFEIDDEEVGDGKVAVVAEVIKDTTPDINKFIFVQEEPKPINMEDIKKAIGYPQIARDAGIEGDVVARVLVDQYGKYLDHKIIKQQHPILAKAVQSKVDRLQFTPAVQGGKPIKFWVNIPFSFKLVN